MPQRDPTPQVPVRTYPTPDITDQVLVEQVTSEHANSGPVVPGTPHPNSREFEGWKLGKQTANPRDENWYLRYYVKDQPADSEFNRDFWNYAVKFAAESNLHRVLIRSYREPKQDYRPRTKGGADPDFAGAILVSEEAQQFPADSEYYAQYFNVIRVYETLPGPWIYTRKSDEDGNISTVAERRNLAADITAKNTETGGVITTIESIGDTDQVSKEVSTLRVWVDKALYEISIPDSVIPVEFRAQIPTNTTSHIRSLTDNPPVIPPVLGVAEFRHSIQIMDKLLYRETIERLGPVTLPITVYGQELTEQYGGGVLRTALTLSNVAMAIDQGFKVVDSSNRPLGNTLFIKTTKELDPAFASAWPTLPGRDWNEEFQTYDAIETQVVEAGVYVPPDPLPSFAVEDLRPLDRWRVRRIRRTVDPGSHIGPANALISYRYHPFQFPGTLDYHRLISFSHREGYRRAAALLAKHTIRTWWLVRNSDDPPTVGNADLGSFDIDVKEIISDTVNVPIYSSGSDIGAQSYPEVLHDDITNSLGAFYPATTPSFTEYYTGISSGSGGTGSVYALTAPGNSYTPGNAITVCGTSCIIVATGVSGSILGITQPAAPPTGVIITGFSSGGACSVSGGGGTGAAFNELIVSYDIPVPGSGWVGTEKVIAADVKYQNIPRLWKIVTESVVMR
ncbi:MAG: hypothetical protein DMF62_00525 [Acidobacteria bacterium]|nr:MAG: hypothetical protein DMF62_00525 [Acidobacteriota bacterium]